MRYLRAADPNPEAGTDKLLRKVETNMGKCYCFVIDQRKDRFDRARERRNRRRIREALAVWKAAIQIVWALVILMMTALGILVTLLAVSNRIGVSCVATTFIMCAVGGPIGEALMGGKR